MMQDISRNIVPRGILSKGESLAQHMYQTFLSLKLTNSRSGFLPTRQIERSSMSGPSYPSLPGQQTLGNMGILECQMTITFVEVKYWVRFNACYQYLQEPKN
jgi:hypothetical protein